MTAFGSNSDGRFEHPKVRAVQSLELPDRQRSVLSRSHQPASVICEEPFATHLKKSNTLFER